MTDQTNSALSTAAEQLYAALLTKQADAPGRARARRMGTYGKAPKPSVAAAPTPTAAAPAPAPAAKSVFRKLLTPRNAALAGGAALLGGAGYGAYRLMKGKAQEPADQGPLMKSAAKKKVVQTMRRYKTQGVPEARTTWPSKAPMSPPVAAAPMPPATPSVAPPAASAVPPAAAAPAETTASKGVGKLRKLLTPRNAGLMAGAALLGGAGYGAYKMLKGKDKVASTVGQLSTAPQEGAATPAILSKLIKEMAKDHPGMKRPMPTNPGPAYPSVEAEKKSKAVINIPMLGKSASAKAFRRLANEVLPIG